jgi:hydrophobe/amphiphile efflux-3 (HAE3) family protein
MSSFEDLLEGIGEFQGRHANAIVIVALLLTVLIGMGIANIRMETDLAKEMPKDEPIMKLQDKVSETFGGYDVVIVVIRLDHTATQTNAVQDIRDPRVIKLITELDRQIRSENAVSSVNSLAQVFGQTGIPPTTEGVRAILDMVPQAKTAFNKDYSATIVQVNANLGSQEQTVRDLQEAIKRDIDSSSVPPGVKVELTGMPPIRVVLMDTLQSDAVFTICLAALSILIVLLLISNPRSDGIVVFAPLVFGLTWTMGTMGWLNIALSIATVGVGAMILGLGVEYSVFYIERYNEERAKGYAQINSMKLAMKEVGGAIIGSSTTVIMGFLALTLASMPMIQHLGATLAIGIFYCVVAAIGLNPALMVVHENVTHYLDVRRHKKLDERIREHHEATK